MRCVQCGVDNRSVARFCKACGVALAPLGAGASDNSELAKRQNGVTRSDTTSGAKTELRKDASGSGATTAGQLSVASKSSSSGAFVVGWLSQRRTVVVSIAVGCLVAIAGVWILQGQQQVKSAKVAHADAGAAPGSSGGTPAVTKSTAVASSVNEPASAQSANPQMAANPSSTDPPIAISRLSPAQVQSSGDGDGHRTQSDAQGNKTTKPSQPASVSPSTKKAQVRPQKADEPVKQVERPTNTNQPVESKSDAVQAAVVVPQSEWHSKLVNEIASCKSKGSFFTRAACEEKAKWRYCDPGSHWGEVPECVKAETQQLN